MARGQKARPDPKDALEELFGEAKPAARSKRGPAPQWQQQIEAVARLPKAQQQFVARMIETVLAQAGAAR